MMKIALITDTHWGARNDSMHFIDFYEKFYRDIFFSTLDKNNIKTVIMLGDTFDRRKYINFVTWKKAKEIYFDELSKRKIETYILVGNHDTSYKNTNDVNSVDLLLREYKNITVIDHPTTITIKDIPICMMPWICAENYNDSMLTLKQTKADICMGHFEIAGFTMHRGMKSEEGLDRNVFRKFDMVFSGHYHHKSNENNISYLGNPYQLTWSDYGDPRGFHIFDLYTRNLEFVENTNLMFHKLVYDDKLESEEEILNKNLDKFHNSYIKLMVVNKTNPFVFDQFIEKLHSINPIDINVIEDHNDIMEEIEDDFIDESQDTVDIINKFIDSIEQKDIDSSRLKNIMKELYIEALSIEKI